MSSSTKRWKRGGDGEKRMERSRQEVNDEMSNRRIRVGSSVLWPTIHSTQLTVLILHSTLAVSLLASFVNSVGANIDCFKCVSLNGNNPSCEDPFHNNFSSTVQLESPCMGGRKGRDGVFPATACIKLAGRYVDSGDSITVRGCALDSGTLTTDTEIIRMSHCGSFYFDDKYVKGCLQSCDDADGCNGSSRRNFRTPLLIFLSLQLVIQLIHSLQFTSETSS